MPLFSTVLSFALLWVKFPLLVGSVNDVDSNAKKVQVDAHIDGEIMRRVHRLAAQQSELMPMELLQDKDTELAQVGQMPGSTQGSQYLSPPQLQQLLGNQRQTPLQAQQSQVAGGQQVSTPVPLAVSAASPTTPQPLVPELRHCVVPQWGATDYACKEGNSYWEENWFDDNRSRTRKVMMPKDVCTIVCPRARYWQIPDETKMECSDGKWRSLESGAVVRSINCYSAEGWKFFFLVCVIVISVIAVRAALSQINKHKESPAAALQEEGARQAERGTPAAALQEEEAPQAERETPQLGQSDRSGN